MLEKKASFASAAHCRRSTHCMASPRHVAHLAFPLSKHRPAAEDGELHGHLRLVPHAPLYKSLYAHAKWFLGVVGLDPRMRSSLLCISLSLDYGGRAVLRRWHLTASIIPPSRLGVVDIRLTDKPIFDASSFGLSSNRGPATQHLDALRLLSCYNVALHDVINWHAFHYLASFTRTAS